MFDNPSMTRRAGPAWLSGAVSLFLFAGFAAPADAQTRIPREQVLIRALEARGYSDVRIVDRDDFEAIVEWCDDGSLERHRIDGELRNRRIRVLGQCDSGFQDAGDRGSRRAIRRDLEAMGFDDVEFERFRAGRPVTVTACRAGATYAIRYVEGVIDELYRDGDCDYTDPFDGGGGFGGGFGDDFDSGFGDDDDFGGGFISPASFVDDIAAFGYREVSVDGRIGDDFLFSACYGARRFLMRVDRNGVIQAQRIDREREFCSADSLGRITFPLRPSDDIIEGEGPLSPAECQHVLNWLAFNETYRISFDPQRYELDEQIEELVQTMAFGFRRCRGVRRIFIDGHTDSRGDPDANYELSELRARSVAIVLRDSGIDPSIMVVQGYGADHPVADNGSSEGRERNRRIEINLEWGRMQL